MQYCLLLTCLIFCCCYLSLVRAVAKVRRCPCKHSRHARLIPPKADCLWLHQSGPPCGNEALAHFPPSVKARNGKPQHSICLSYDFVNKTLHRRGSGNDGDGNGPYCVQHINGTHVPVKCSNCTAHDLYDKLRSDSYGDPWWWLPDWGMQGEIL
ncbi:Ba161 [Baboon cytomegalovirus]|nr:Ba161 [Baboon cytomegalovirus]